VNATWSPSVVAIIVAGTGSGGGMHPCRVGIISGSHPLGIVTPPAGDRPRESDHFPNVPEWRKPNSATGFQTTSISRLRTGDHPAQSPGGDQKQDQGVERQDS
jgi:hypothetical protein